MPNDALKEFVKIERAQKTKLLLEDDAAKL